MKILEFAEEEFKADRVVKTDTDIIGYVGDTEVFAFRGISDFSLFTLDGEFDPPDVDEVFALRTENMELKLALAELAEAQENDKREMQLALAELAEIVSGGV